MLGGLISSFVLLVGAVLIIIKAIPRIINPEPINVELVIWFAIFGVIVNGIAAINTSKGQSINEKVISLHLFEDVLGWVALLVAAVVMNFWKIYMIDAILSIVFTIYIMFHVYKNLKKIIGVFLEKAPLEPSIAKIKETVVDKVIIKDIHHIHFWSLEGNIPLLTFHAVIGSNQKIESVHEAIEKMHHNLKDLGIHHVTIEIEQERKVCPSDNCEDGFDLEKTKHTHRH